MVEVGGVQTLKFGLHLPLFTSESLKKESDITENFCQTILRILDIEFNNLGSNLFSSTWFESRFLQWKDLP
jgi:hypothetical protein